MRVWGERVMSLLFERADFFSQIQLILTLTEENIIIPFTLRLKFVILRLG